jgi:hypothetical protein
LFRWEKKIDLGNLMIWKEEYKEKQGKKCKKLEQNKQKPLLPEQTKSSPE